MTMTEMPGLDPAISSSTVPPEMAGSGPAMTCLRRTDQGRDNRMTSIDYGKLYSDGLPDPAPKWAPFPPYYFVGGNNDPEQIPIEGLVEAAASVLRREGSKLAIYNLGLGPQGYPGLRQFVPTRCKPHRGL